MVSWRELSWVQKTGWAVTLLIGISAFCVKPVARAATPKLAAAAAFDSETRLDPWGNPYQEWTNCWGPADAEVIVSGGPNGVFEDDTPTKGIVLGGAGDDISLSYPDVESLSARALAWSRAGFLGLAGSLGWGLMGLALLRRPRGTTQGEALRAAVVTSAPIAVLLAVGIYWGELQASIPWLANAPALVSDRALLIPVPIAVAGSVSAVCFLAVFGWRARLAPPE